MILIFQVSNTYQEKQQKQQTQILFQTTPKKSPKNFAELPPKEKSWMFGFPTRNPLTPRVFSLVQKNGVTPAPSDKNTIQTRPLFRTFRSRGVAVVSLEACESMEVTVGTPKVVRLPKPSATEFPMEEEQLGCRLSPMASGERFFYGQTWVFYGK